MTIALPRRLTRQSQQEQVSRSQFSEHMTAFGWLVGKQDLDLGEDFTVHIYFDGRPSGVDFYVQLKSMTRLEKEKRKPALAYNFTVHDLLHWEPFALPVVLVVWDVGLREGRWILVRKAIAQLDQENPAWKSNKSSATVHMPHENDTSNGGLERMRIEIAQQVMPLLIRRNENLEGHFKFRFPDTEEGRRTLEGVKKAFEEGEPVYVDGKFIESFGLPPSLARWFMPAESRPISLEIGPPIDTNPRMFSIELRGRNGQRVAFERVLFRTTKQGTKRDVLESDPSTSPFSWTITISKGSTKINMSVSWTLRSGGHNAAIMCEVLRMLAIMAAGGQFVLSFPTLSAETIVHDFEPHNAPPFEPPFVECVNILYYVQNVTGVSILIPDELSMQDVLTARLIYLVLTTGYAAPISYAEFTYPALPKAELMQVYEIFDASHNIEVSSEDEDSSIQVCGATVPLGPSKITLRGRLKESRDELKRRIDAVPEDQTAKLTLVDVSVTREYTRWLLSV